VTLGPMAILDRYPIMPSFFAFVALVLAGFGYVMGKSFVE